MKKLIFIALIITGCASKPKPKPYYNNTQTNFQREMLEKYKK